MDPSDAIQIIILIILLMLSAFFSSAETALTTVNKIRIRSLADEGNKRAEAILDVTKDSSKLLSAILIGNNVVNTAAASLTFPPKPMEGKARATAAAVPAARAAILPFRTCLNRNRVRRNECIVRIHTPLFF